MKCEKCKVLERQLAILKERFDFVESLLDEVIKEGLEQSKKEAKK